MQYFYGEFFQQDNMMYIMIFDEAPEIHNGVFQWPLRGNEAISPFVTLKHHPQW